MIVNEDFLSKLRQSFKLNLYEVKIWTALLSRGTSTAGELSEISDVPRSRTYDVLESLEKKGFILMKIGKPIKYLAVKPKEVVEKTKKVAKIEADSHIKKLSNMVGTELFSELDLLYKQGIEFVEASDLTGSIKGRHNLYLHMENLMKNAESSVCLMTSAKGLARKSESLKHTFEQLSKKGVKIKIAAPVTKDSAAAVRDLKNFAEIKHLEKPDARFCVIDGKDVMFMLMDDNEVHASYDVGIWANTPFFANTLNHLFDLAWNGMELGNKVLKKL